MDSFTNFSCLDSLHSDALNSRIFCMIGSFSTWWSGKSRPDPDDVDGRHLSSFSDLGMAATSDHVRKKGVVEVSTGMSERTARFDHYHSKTNLTAQPSVSRSQSDLRCRCRLRTASTATEK